MATKKPTQEEIEDMRQGICDDINDLSNDEVLLVRKALTLFREGKKNEASRKKKRG
jgi:hypothetical protein